MAPAHADGGNRNTGPERTTGGRCQVGWVCWRTLPERGASPLLFGLPSLTPLYNCTYLQTVFARGRVENNRRRMKKQVKLDVR